MTQIKDVIHLYLGCEVIAKEGSMNYTLSGIDRKGNALFYDAHGNEMWLPEGWKMSLRRLDSLTWADCPDWFKDWMPDGFDILISREAKYFYIEIDSKANDGFRLTIHSDGSMSCECKDNGEQYGYKGGKLFAHLLKQGFDLFGLIDSGQAIDKNLKS